VRAVTRVLAGGPPVDPLAVAGEDGVFLAARGVTLAGSGTAAVLPLPAGLSDRRALRSAEGWLEAVEQDDPLRLPGTGPVAFGALDFEQGSPGSMVVPAVIYGRSTDGTEWVTLVGDDGLEEPSRRWLLGRFPSLPRLEPRRQPEFVACEPADYAGAVAAATGRISAGDLRKVVLARRLEVDLGGPVVATAVLRRMAAEEPAATAFLFGHRDGAFVGASPELLVSRRGRYVLSHPLAGTAARGPEGAEGLLGSVKDLEEHELVVADIAGVLDPRCVELVVPGGPSLVALHSMNHLGTRIEGRLIAEDGGPPSALELVAALHPTPAVGGVPLPAALEVIEALEPGPRGPWAGPLGWLDARGDGDWVVGLRSAIISGSTAVVWAGAGIVAASDPRAELEETAVKLAPVLEGLAPGGAAILERCSLRS
jgi:menaquinone-specific isochorismate synthase